jgi:hypothetical protein
VCGWNRCPALETTTTFLPLTLRTQYGIPLRLHFLGKPRALAIFSPALGFSAIITM